MDERLASGEAMQKVAEHETRKMIQGVGRREDQEDDMTTEHITANHRPQSQRMEQGAEAALEYYSPCR